MKLSLIALLTVAAQQVTSLGFSTYKQIIEGQDNSGTISYSPLERSSTIFLYIQITAGSDHTDIINDFKTLAENYGSQGVGVIPRVRYGQPDGSVDTEPDESILLDDVSTWAQVFASAADTIDIPVIQAGFLGPWGEWHDGQYSQARGLAESVSNRAIKSQIIKTLLSSGQKVALRYPEDHSALVNGTRTVTIHNDCIFDGGANGLDGGTYPSDSRAYWVAYTKAVASGNTYGGEGCDNAGVSTFDWTDTATLCGDNGLIPYIKSFGISYLNQGFPDPLASLIQSGSSCALEIQAALEANN